MSDITIITTCMNRSKFLELTLPTWVNQPIKEIIVLDWSSKESIKPIIDKYQNGKIILARVEGKEFFSKSKAQNLVHRLTQLNKADYILAIDCDIMLGTGFIEAHPMNDTIFYSGAGNIGDSFPIRSTTGTNLISYANFLQVGGYNESMEGWGFEDSDFISRLKTILEHKYFDPNLIKHINHSNYLRSENYKTKDIYDSYYLNECFSRDPINIYEKQDVILYYPNGDVKKINI